MPDNSGEFSPNFQGTDNFYAILLQNIINLQFTLWNSHMPKPNIKKESLKRIAFDYKYKNPQWNSTLYYCTLYPQHATFLILGRQWIQWVKWKRKKKKDVWWNIACTSKKTKLLEDLD